MIKKSLLLFSVNVLGRAFQYGYRLIMSYFLTLREFGILSAALPYQSFVLLFTSSSVTTTVSKFVSQYKVGEKEKICNVFSLLIVGIFISLILYFSTGLVSSFFGADFAESEYLLKILSLSVPFAVLLSICTGVLLGYEKAESVSFFLILYECAMLFFSYVFVQYFGLDGAAHGIFFGYILSGGAAFVVILRFRLPVQIVSAEIVRVLTFSLPVLVGIIGLWGLLNVDTLILARYASAEEVGLYGMASPTARLIFAFSAALSALLVPKVSELQVEGKDTAKSIRSSFEVCALVTLPMALAIAAFSKEILYVLFGNWQGYFSLMILSVGMFFYSLFFIGYSALQGLGIPGRSMMTALATFGCNIALCFLLIPHYMLGGAALATSLSCILGLGLTLVILRTGFMPRMQYLVVMLPFFVFENAVGIMGSRLVTMVVYGAVGLPVIMLYFYLSRRYLHVQE